MKSEHRHELKTNELADWLAHFPEWLKANRRTIIYVAVVLIAVLASYIWSRYQKNVVAANEKAAFTQLITQIPQNKALVIQAANEGKDNAFILLDASKKLRNMAAQTKDKELAALAYIKSAELIRAELLYRVETPRQEEVAKQISEAKDAYTKAAEKAAADPALLAKAKFGLGLCEEELGNFEQAREIYREIAEDPAFAHTVTADQAQMRLDTMDDYKTRVAFAPAPKIAPSAPASPQIEIEQPAEPLTPPVELFGESETPNAAPATDDTNSSTN